MLALALLASAAQPAAAQEDRETSTITFYGHVFGHTAAQPMPANTEFPVGEDNYGLGSFDWCTPAGGAVGVPPVPDPSHNCDNNYNTMLALVSTAGFVDVTSPDEFDYAKLHNERGQTKDIVLDTTKDIEATIWMSLDLHAWAVSGAETNCIIPNPEDTSCPYPYWGWDPGMAPNFKVRATLYHATLGEHGASASEAPPVQEALQAGSATVVAQGETAPENVMTGLPGAPNVLGFNINLGKAQVDTVPRSDDFFLVFDWWSEGPGGKYNIHNWRIWGGEFFPPTFTLPVKNALDVETVSPRFVHDKLVILTIINTPWGSYDVDPAGTELMITDASGREVVPQSIEVFGDYSVAHGGHYKPVNVTYIWDYKKDGLEPGTYTAMVHARNWQGSAEAVCEATFTVRPNGQPGPVESGLCGIQTTTAQERQQLEEGAAQDAGSRGHALGDPAPLSEAAANALAPLVMGLALVARPRRWTR